MDFIRHIYFCFQSLYGTNLCDYLKGIDCNQAITNQNQFIPIFLVTLGVVALITALYYFVKHSSFNKIGSWFVVMAVIAIVTWSIGFGMTYSKLSSMPNYIIYGIGNVEPLIDENGEVTCDSCECLQPTDYATEQIHTSDFVGFGFANAIIAVMLFVILSFILKRFSVYCTHTPWKSKFFTRNN